MQDTLIPVDATVECTDGRAGYVSTVIVNPVKQEVTHVVVQTSKDTDRIVALDRIERTEDDKIYLSCTVAELNAMPIFTETHYIRSEHPDYTMYQSGGYQSPYATNIQEDYVSVADEQVPVGELAVHRGTTVAATDGKVGELEEFVIDATTGHVTHLILQKGHLWGKRDIAIPVTAIDHTGGATVFLRLSKADVNKLPNVKVQHHYHG